MAKVPRKNTDGQTALTVRSPRSDVRFHMARWWYYSAGTTVILARLDVRYYGEDMTLVLMMVVLAFGLLYVAVVAEERQMQEATKPRKR